MALYSWQIPDTCGCCLLLSPSNSATLLRGPSCAGLRIHAHAADILFQFLAFQSLHADIADTLFHAFHIPLSDTAATDITGCPDCTGLPLHQLSC